MREFEKTLVSNLKNEINLYHLKLEGTNAEIGYSVGCLAKGTHNINRMTNIDPSKVRTQYDYLKSYYPEHYARMTGFAQAYGVSLKDYSYDFSYFGRVPDGTACSAVYYPPASTDTGRGYISRNLDFSIPKDLARPSFPFKYAYLVEMRPEGCLASISLWCFDVFGLALEGINAKGLAVVHLADYDTRVDHANLATHQTERGFNEVLPIQYLLDTCSTVGEAATALKNMEHYHVAIPTHLLVADSQGAAFVFEYSHDGTRKVFIRGNATAPLIITNFQLNRLSDSAMRKKMESRFNENGLDRYRDLEERIRQTQLPIPEKSIQEINSAVYVCKENPGSVERTLYHCIYDTTSASVKICLLPGIQRSLSCFNKFKLLS